MKPMRCGEPSPLSQKGMRLVTILYFCDEEMEFERRKPQGRAKCMVELGLKMRKLGTLCPRFVTESLHQHTFES